MKIYVKDIIRILRERNKITQAELGHILGFKNFGKAIRAVKHIELEGKVTKEEIKILSKYFNVEEKFFRDFDLETEIKKNEGLHLSSHLLDLFDEFERRVEMWNMLAKENYRDFILIDMLRFIESEGGLKKYNKEVQNEIKNDLQKRIKPKAVGI